MFAFLATAERFGLIQQIDRWVVRQAVRLIAAHERADRDIAASGPTSRVTGADERLGEEQPAERDASEKSLLLTR